MFQARTVHCFRAANMKLNRNLFSKRLGNELGMKTIGKKVLFILCNASVIDHDFKSNRYIIRL